MNNMNQKITITLFIFFEFNNLYLKIFKEMYFTNNNYFLNSIILTISGLKKAVNIECIII